MKKKYFLKNSAFLIISIFLILNLFGCKKETSLDIPIPTVHVENFKDKFQLIRNGKPFIIKGGASHPDYLKELKEAGGNTARIYDTINLKEILDEAHNLGLAVVVDIPLPQFKNDPYFYEDDHYFIPLKKRVERVVQQHKDHPALLYWNLGNEIQYPLFYKRTLFFSNYNSLIKLIKKIDPNHPVSTATIGGNKLRIISIGVRSSNLDFISFNLFGNLTHLQNKLESLKPFWRGPYTISEWGANGPWEVEQTFWEAPIEQASTQKAEDIKERYQKYIQPFQNQRQLGSFIFYWGKKNEVTPTWFSLFDDKGKKNQSIFELEKIWKDHDLTYSGPQVDYILLNGKGGALDNILLLPDNIAVAELVYPKKKNKNLEITWEIRKESWFREDKSSLLSIINSNVSNIIHFKAPLEEGPYRLFVYATNTSEYFATANIPFYVLKPKDGE